MTNHIDLAAPTSNRIEKFCTRLVPVHIKQPGNLRRAYQATASYLLCSAGVARKFATAFDGQIEISKVYAEDVLRPASFLLPRASPYKKLLNNMLMRVIEAGLVSEIQSRHWQRTLRRPSTIESEDNWRKLQLNESILSFIVLGAGLGVSMCGILM
ncbi:hypothetical protein MRX96_035781 [Rhipicephalus microplus]